jgi:hypothetical protein
VTAAGRYSLETAKATFARQGVLGDQELARISIDGQIGVFTFDGYRNFVRPIPFAELRSRGIANAANLVTSQEVTFSQLGAIIQLAY